MIFNSNAIIYYTTILGRRHVHSSMMKNGEWCFHSSRYGINAYNRKTYNALGNRKVIKLSPHPKIVKSVNMAVVRLRDGKVLKDMHLENNGITEYTMLLNYCDEDLLSYVKITRGNDKGGIGQEDFRFSF